MAGTRIYESTRGWGRLWRWFYKIIDRFTCRDYRLEKLKQAVIHTHRIFQAHLDSLQQHISCYDTYLKKVGGGYEVAEGPVHVARRTILLWNRSTLPFIKLMRQCEYPKLNQLFQMCFGENIDLSTLWHTSSIATAEAAGKVIEVEGLSQGPLPLEVLKKIVKNKSLNSFDQKELNKWIKRIDQVPDCVDQLHGALKCIVDCYRPGNHQEVSRSNEIARLEVFLEDKGCRVFKQCDKQHIQWRNELKNGMALTYGNQQWILDSQIPSTKIHGDSTFVYATDHVAKVVLVAQNKALLAMRQLRQQSPNDWGIEPACLEVCDDGRWGIMERLQPLESRQWHTLPGETEVHSEDSLLVKELCELIEKLVKQQMMPSNFSATSLMYDQQYRLKALHLETSFGKKSFDFNALEDFVFACAANNPVIFKHLMSASSLSMHPIGIFYHELIKNALKGDQTTIDDMAGIYKIVDPKVVDRGIVLVKEVLALRDQLCLKMRQAYPNRDMKSIVTEVNTKLMQSHKETKACGRLFFLT